MTRLLLLSLCLLVLAPLPAAARITGQPDNWHREQPETRDLASIRRSGVLKVLVNQSRNSSGEVKGEPIGVEYRRLRAFEQYLNSRSPSARNLTLKLIPKPKDQLLAALQRGEGDLVAPGELLPAHDGLQVSPSAPVRADVPLVLVARKATGATRAWSSCPGGPSRCRPAAPPRAPSSWSTSAWRNAAWHRSVSKSWTLPWPSRM